MQTAAVNGQCGRNQKGKPFRFSDLRSDVKGDQERIRGIKKQQRKSASKVVTPMQIAEKLRKKQKSVNPKTSSFRPATAFSDSDRTDNVRAPWRRKREQIEKRGPSRPDQQRKRGSVRSDTPPRNTAVHSKLLAATPVMRDTGNMVNDTGFEYPESDGDDVSTPGSSTSISPPPPR